VYITAYLRMVDPSGAQESRGDCHKRQVRAICNNLRAAFLHRARLSEQTATQTLNPKPQTRNPHAATGATPCPITPRWPRQGGMQRVLLHFTMRARSASRRSCRSTRPTPTDTSHAQRRSRGGCLTCVKRFVHLFICATLVDMCCRLQAEGII